MSSPAGPEIDNATAIANRREIAASLRSTGYPATANAIEDLCNRLEKSDKALSELIRENRVSELRASGYEEDYIENLLSKESNA